jgi:lipopolysaccharide/colanic/teichoic acid biosynthesis glycosyltransferase
MTKLPFVSLLPKSEMPGIAFAESSAHRAARPDEGRSADEILTSFMHIVVATLALIFFSPLMCLIAAAIYVQDGGPILFAHRRIGQSGRTFYCLKFRSMAVDAEARLAALLAEDPGARAEWELDHKLRNDPRVTRLGAFLRKTSLDELPQLLNVLRGDMCLVGPRPIVEAEVVKYGRRFSDYCAVKPGITGLWQVSGRNDTSYRTRVALDSVYAHRRCLKLDAYILACTLPAVLARRGSY